MIRFILFIVCLTPALAQLPAGFVQRQIARNLNPTTLTFAPNGQLFVVGKDGKIFEIIKDVLAPDPFMVVPNVDTYNERGLSGLCFHPDFPRTPYFYVYYTVKGADHNRLSRFRMNGSVADPKSETILFDFDPLVGTIHNAGVLRFGTDRKLYVSLGDGSNAAMAQSLNSYLGKILRMNEDGSVPADNPFVGQATGAYQVIYALGFRNPFSMDIDPVSGQILVGDVGGDLFEEINDVRAGYNYGWPLIEGPRTNQDPPAHYADPIHAYTHDPDCAVAGLTFYNPPTLRFPAEYKGRAFFADYCGGTIRTIDPTNGNVLGTFVTDIDRPIALATSPDGYVYYIARAGHGGGSTQDNTVTSNGSVHKISYFDSGLPYITEQSTGKLVPVGESVTLEVDAVGQKPLNYQWYRNGKLLTGANQNQYTLSSPALADNGASFMCKVSSALGADTSDPMVVRVVQGQRPIVRIQQPLSNATYTAGSTITFAGQATNASQQPLPNSSLIWWIDFHHEDHLHPALDPVSGLTSGTYKVPRVGETSTEVWYRIHLQATDISGLTAETFVDVKPELSYVTIGSKPAGAQLIMDGQPQETELNFGAVVGSLRTLVAKPYLARPDGFYKFTGWSTGQTSTIITYEVPASKVPLTMNYTALPSAGGNGLLAEYYTNTSEFTGKPTLVRVDPTIDFYWGNNAPDSQISPDNFVVRWTGKFQAPITDTYTISTETDDGVRLWINEKLVIDKWELQPSTEWSTVMDLTAGRKYAIRFEFREGQGEAVAHLRWSSPQFDKAAISQSQLFNEQIVTASEPAVTGGLRVFPQPAHDQLTVRYASVMPGPVHILITDLLGRCVYQQTAHSTAGSNDYFISTANWPAGLYQLGIAPASASQSAIFQRILVH